MSKKNFKAGLEKAVNQTSYGSAEEAASSGPNKTKKARTTKKQPGESSSHEVKLTGALTIENAPDIKKRLLAGIKKQGELIIRGEGIEKVDLSVVQLLLGLRQTAHKMKKPVAFDLPIDNDAKQLLDNAGLFDTEIFKTQ